ncbi:MAG: hypothetical protein ACIAXF_03805 [Phycisphaerales bacterium JB063]
MSNPTDPNPLDWVEPMLLGELDDARLAALERWLTEDEANRAAFLREVHLCRGIRRALFSEDSSLALDDAWDEDELEIVAGPADPDVMSEVVDMALAERKRHEVEAKAQRLLLEDQAKQQPRRRPAPPSTSKSQWAIPMPVLLGAMAAMLAIVVYLFSPGDDTPTPDALTDAHPPSHQPRGPGAAVAPLMAAVVEQTHMAQWAGGSAARPGPNGQMPAGEYTLTAGAVRLRTEYGAVLMIDGPARFELSNDNTGRLLSGRLTADARNAQPGFRLQTPSANLDSFDATFGVYVDGHGKTQAHVFAGKVDLSNASGQGETLQLTADDSAVVTSRSALPEAAPVVSEQFALDMSALSGEPFVSGQIDYHRHMPKTVVMNRGPQSPRAWVVLESTGRPLQRGTAWAQGYPERPRMLTHPEGRVVDSYLIVFDPDDETNQFKTARFELTFPGEVLTVITEDAGLAESHEWYGDPDTQYTLGPLLVDGLEGEPGNVDAAGFVPDTITFSADRRTLRVFLGVHNGADALRVLVLRPSRVGGGPAFAPAFRYAVYSHYGVAEQYASSRAYHAPRRGFSATRLSAATISLKGENHDE